MTYEELIEGDRPVLAVSDDGSLQSPPVPVKRVLFVFGMEGAPLRYRVQLPAEALALFGITSQVCYYSDPQLESFAEQADVVILYRVLATERLLACIKSWGERRMPVLYDLDDLVFDPEEALKIPAMSALPPKRAKWWRQYVSYYRTAMQACDGFIGSTEPLCEHARKLLGIPTMRFPNGVGQRLARLADLALKQPKSEGGLRIGYLSGSLSHDLDWAYIEPALLSVLDQFRDAELWLIGSISQTANLKKLGERVTRIPMQPWQYLPGIIRQLDVNLAPLTPDNRFNEAKSAIKWLEAALVCTPTLASSTQPFREAIQHNVNGLLAETPEDWHACLSDLLRDAELRKRLGSRARSDALDRWSPPQQGHRYIEILQWATQLVAESPRPSRVTFVPVVLDEPPRPHPVEPYAMTLLLNRDDFIKVLTAAVRSDAGLEFSLPTGGARVLRIDLLFATYGGPGAPIAVTLCDLETKIALARAIAPADQIAEGAWAAFHFQLERPAEAVVVRVERLPEQSSNTSWTRAKSKIALWAEAEGSHTSGGELQFGAPCVRLWAQEEFPVALLSLSAGHTDSFARLKSQARLAQHTWRVKGIAGLTRRTATSLTARARKLTLALIRHKRING